MKSGISGARLIGVTAWFDARLSVSVLANCDRSSPPGPHPGQVCAKIGIQGSWVKVMSASCKNVSERSKSELGKEKPSSNPVVWMGNQCEGMDSLNTFLARRETRDQQWIPTKPNPSKGLPSCLLIPVIPSPTPFDKPMGSWAWRDSKVLNGMLSFKVTSCVKRSWSSSSKSSETSLVLQAEALADRELNLRLCDI